MLLFLCMEALVAGMRIPYLHRHGGLDMKAFSSSVFPRIAFIICLQGAISLGLYAIGTQPLLTMAFICISMLCGITLMWAVVLNAQERTRMMQIITRKKA